VVVQAPEHVIENTSSKRKAAGDPKKLRKLRLKKPPERGYAPWDAATLERLRSSEPEPLVSRFSIGTSMMLNVLCRKEEDGCRAMKALIRGCHDSNQRKRAHGRSAIAVFRALVEADIVTMNGDGLSVNADLQEDFSLNHALSLYAVEVIESLDHEDRHYALLVLTVIEATLEDPGAILFRQVDTLKGRKILELSLAPRPGSRRGVGSRRLLAPRLVQSSMDSMAATQRGSLVSPRAKAQREARSAGDAPLNSATSARSSACAEE